MRIYRNRSVEEANTYKVKEKTTKDSSQVSKFNPVPLYRSYGRTKREYLIWEIIKQILMKTIVVLFLLFILSFPVIIITTFIVFGNILSSAILIFIFILFLLLLITRTIRKRIKFYVRLKKLCRENKYKLEFKRNFLASFRYSPDKIDFILNTGTHNYIVHYFTANKYNSSLNFLEKGKIVLKKYPLNNKFSFIFDRKVKENIYDISFPGKYKLDKKVNLNVLVVNPVCKEFFEADINRGGIVPSGNGACIFDMTVFTGSGFIEAVKRNERTQISDTFH